MAGIRTTEHKVVGTVRWRAVEPVQAGGPIEFVDSWREQHIVTVKVPQLTGVPTFGGPFSGNVAFYREAAPQLTTAWAEVESRGLLDRVLFWSGSFNPRLIRGSTTVPSNHAFGTAFDINHQWNGLGVTPPAAGAKGSVRDLVPVFEKYGFFWGGNYQKRKDGMHFEVARLGKPQAGTAPACVEVFINGAQQVVPALFINGQTWIGVRALVGKLGGNIGKVTTQASGSGVGLGVTLRLNGSEHELTGRVVGDVGYVKFGDIASFYGCPYTFNNARKRLEISTA